MQGNGDRLFYLGLGPMAAILLGVGLMPLRGLTVASNFTFAFVALTIVAGELGGRGPALATALVSVLSLDFFLTTPYLHLAIQDKDDVIAFLGLALCGLLAAALGSSRRERLLAGRQIGLLHAALREGASAGPVDSGLQQLVDARTRSVPAGGDRRPRRGRKAARAGGERRGFRVRSSHGRERRGARRHDRALGLAGERPPAGDGCAPAARRGRAPGRSAGWTSGATSSRREQRRSPACAGPRGRDDGGQAVEERTPKRP